MWALNFLVVLLIPTVILGICYLFWHRAYSLREVAIQFGVQLLICGVIFLLTFNWNLMDTELWNGRVTGKERKVVPCSHTYTCNCHPCGKNSTCCSICHLHAYDVDWRVYTSAGETFNIARVNLQGTIEPKRWTSTKIGEPVCSEHSYKNYIKANPENLQIQKGWKEKFKNKLIKYPIKVYDYWHCNRVINVANSKVVDGTWNVTLEEMLGDLGPKKKCNVAIVILRNEDPMIYYALREDWIGGKKNDIIPIISVDDNDNIQWVQVMTFAKNDMINITLRDNIMDIKQLTKDKLFDILKKDITEQYTRKSMEDYKYLAETRALSNTQLMWLIIICTLISIGLSIYFIKNDETDDTIY
jgi:hypothetical protein